MTANLLSRLQGLTAPSREVDAHVHALAIGGRVHFIDDGDAVIERPIDGMWIRGIYPLKGKTIPRYTVSLDATVALCERVLPGWAKGFDGGPKTCIAFVDPHDYDDRMFGARYTACAPTPAIALLIAILTALEARDVTE